MTKRPISEALHQRIYATDCRGRTRTGGLEGMNLASFQTAPLCRIPLSGYVRFAGDLSRPVITLDFVGNREKMGYGPSASRGSLTGIPLGRFPAGNGGFQKKVFTCRPLSCFPCIHNTTDAISKTIKGFLRLARVLSDAGTAQRFDRSIPSQPRFAPRSIPRRNTPAAAPGNGYLAHGQSCR